MFSNLGPLFKATLRQTEHLDTRMGIRKDDPRDEGKKRDPREDEPDDDSLWEDSMGVSIAALRAFLTDFVAGKTGRAAGAAAQTPVADAPLTAPEMSPVQDTKHSRAANAYQTIADKTGGAHAPSAPAAPQSDLDLVQSDEVRAMHILIADLAALEAAGHTTLALEKSDSFVHSLQEAVERLKSGN